MLTRLAADAVLLLHLAFIVFAVSGGLWVLRRPRAAWLHLPAMAWATWVVAADRECPLTAIENGLRRTAGQAGYQGGFIEHYLLPLIYPPGLTGPQQTAVAAGFAIWSLAVYALAIRRHRQRRRPA